MITPDRVRAAVLAAFGEPLSVESFTLPSLAPAEILVRVLAAGVCGSDVHMWQGLDPRIPLPTILGHEGVGEVIVAEPWPDGKPRRTVEGGELRPGDRVIWNRGVSCGRCHYCTVLSQTALCPNRWVYGIQRSSARPPYLVGCYSEALLLDAATDVLTFDRATEPEVMVAASCSGATAAHALELCPPIPGDTVVIQGAGPIGAFMAALARAGGAREIVVIAGTPGRLTICRDLGATRTLHRRETSLAQRRETILDLTDGRGADIVFEATGDPSAMDEGLSLVRNGGAYALVGLAEPRPAVPIDCFNLTRRNIRLQGVWVSDTSHLKRAVDAVAEQPAAFARLVTHRFHLDQATEGLRSVASRQATKAVILP